MVFFFLLALPVITIFRPPIEPGAIVSSPSAPAQSPVENLPTPKPVATANNGFRLIVAANPRLNGNQNFSPPTNSVVITNGEHLQMLIEQEQTR